MKGKFEHPLGIKTAGRTTVEVGRDPDLDAFIMALPVEHGSHVWATIVLHRVAVKEATGDHDCGNPNCHRQLQVLPVGMIHVDDNVHCIICKKPLSADSVRSRCPGDPDGGYVPTQRQFRDDWTEAERLAWAESDNKKKGL